MSEPKPKPEVHTSGSPTTDARVIPTGGDSVSDLHRAHMIQMNDPVMLTADGVESPETGDEPGFGGSDSVQRLHDAVMREQAEPRDGFEPVPFWVAIVCGALLMWGGYYIGANTADFRRDIFDVPNPKATEVITAPDPDPQTVDELKAIGAQKYQSICAACHLPTGEGKPAENIPPLDGSEWVVGEQAAPERLAHILLYGLKGPVTVKGKTFSGATMPAQGGLLKDYEIAGVLTYVRNSWSNKGDPDNAKPAITAAVVKAVRAKEKDGKKRPTDGSDSVTMEELLKIPIGPAAPPKK
ncbi:MAG: cytochrome c [Planctomycetia bacterium]|nr:cytochrome c [Planctomycetia bacterium]